MSDTPLIVKIAELAAALGVKSIKDLPGCWEHQVDERWWMAFNGHRERVKCSEGAEIPPFTCYVTFNGWPAGLLDPAGGVIAAGELANEETFGAALDAAIARTRREEAGSE